MDNDFRKPLYIQLKNNIKDKIVNGEYPVGSFIPSERYMSITYGINRMTVRKSIKCLVDEGLVRNIHGKGNMVIANHGKIALGKDSFGSLGESVIFAGMKLSRKVISVKLVDSSIHPDFLKDEQVVELVRMQYANGSPYAYQKAYMPYSLFPDILNMDFSTESLYEYRITHFPKPTYCDSSLVVITPDEEVKEMLELAEGKKAYYISYTNYTKRGNRLIEYTKSYQVPGSSSFETEVEY